MTHIENGIDAAMSSGYAAANAGAMDAVLWHPKMAPKNES